MGVEPFIKYGELRKLKDDESLDAISEFLCIVRLKEVRNFVIYMILILLYRLLLIKIDLTSWLTCFSMGKSLGGGYQPYLEESVMLGSIFPF